jgi:hypothetical protein
MPHYFVICRKRSSNITHFGKIASFKLISLVDRIYNDSSRPYNCSRHGRRRKLSAFVQFSSKYNVELFDLDPRCSC